MERANAAGARGAALWVVAAVGYLAFEAAAAAAFEPGYSYARNYISDLAVPGGALVHGQLVHSPRAHLMQAAFYVQGVLFLAGAALMTGVPDNARARAFLGAVAANAVGNVVIGTLHGGAVHVAGAVLAIVGGNAAILTGPAAIGALGARRWYSRASKVVAILGLSCLVMLMFDSATRTARLLPDGVWERGSVYSITAWQLLTAACLLRRPTRVAARSGFPQRPGRRR